MPLYFIARSSYLMSQLQHGSCVAFFMFCSGSRYFQFVSQLIYIYYLLTRVPVYFSITCHLNTFYFYFIILRNSCLTN